jgi:Ca2+-binding EF-hand superfamily protein
MTFTTRTTFRATLLAIAIGAGSVGPAAAAEPPAGAFPYLPKTYGEFMKMKPADSMKMMDPTNKGYVTREEFMKFQGMMFDKMDTNKDGQLSHDEWVKGIHSGP